MQEKISIKGGGHKMAGGFTIDVNNIEKFKDFVLKKFKNKDKDNKKKNLCIWTV